MELVLVDENDVAIGTMEKMEVHQKALLHRAVSVFIFNDKGETLLQRRASKKYHSGNLWSNTCCTHPAPGETVESAAEKRLMEEMGFTTSLKKAFHFIYKTAFSNGLTEYEFDHVLVGTYSGEVFPNKDEVSDFCYKSIDDIKESLKSHPDKYTEWFKIALPKIEEYQDKLMQLY
jgi:isopentenyl-diphosphate delta-isomerase